MNKKTFLSIVFSLTLLPGFALANDATTSTPPSVSMEAASSGGGGRAILGTVNARKEMFSNAEAVKIYSRFHGRWARYWVEWPYLFTDGAFSRKGRSYGGKFAIYDFRSNTLRQGGMHSEYKDLISWYGGQLSITSEGLDGGAMTNFSPQTSPANGVKTYNKTCASNWGGTCYSYSYSYLFYWVR